MALYSSGDCFAALQNTSKGHSEVKGLAFLKVQLIAGALGVPGYATGDPALVVSEVDQTIRQGNPTKQKAPAP
ncbi:MAG: hypothetical protein CML03_00365 [Pseudooceanicola sp.]|nr:hypothetical protein [Pseudooceanicola sp.]